MKGKRRYVALLTCLLCLTSCFGKDTTTYPSAYATSPKMTIDQVLLPTSPGEKTIEDEKKRIHIDYSNTNLGYVRIKRMDQDFAQMKVLITKDKTKNPWWYDLNTKDEFVSFPLSEGSGTYQMEVRIKNEETGKYRLIFSMELEVRLENEQIPFLYPNQVVQYDQDTKAIQKAFALCEDKETDLERIKTIYDFVVTTIAYDYDKSEETSKPNVYVLPDIDGSLKKEKGICYDYAAMVCAMLRSQHIPTRVVVGNTEIEYHAWIEVWLEGEGWINPEVFFEKEQWSRLDPTFASTKADYDGEYEALNYF